MEDVIEMGTTGIAPDNELEQRYIRYKDVIKPIVLLQINYIKTCKCAKNPCNYWKTKIFRISIP